MPLSGPETFQALLSEGSLYMNLLQLRSEETGKTLEAIRASLGTSPDPGADVVALLAGGWRQQLVGCAAALLAEPDERIRAALWGAFDMGSWVSPQVTVVVWAIDPDFAVQAKRRLLQRCPVRMDGRESMEPVARKLHYGAAHLLSNNYKGMAALMERLARDAESRQWMMEHISLEDATLALLMGQEDGGADFAAVWASRVAAFLPGRVPAAGSAELSPSFGEPVSPQLMELWIRNTLPEAARSLKVPEEALLRLMTGKDAGAGFLDPVLGPAWGAGAQSAELTGLWDQAMEISAVDRRRSQLLSLPWPYSGLLLGRMGIQREMGSRSGKIERGPGLAPYKFQASCQESGYRIQLRPAPARAREADSGPIILRRRPLEESAADAVAYGARDTGEMSGGAAPALLQAAGPELESALRLGLARTDRQIGDVVVTPAFGLEERFVGCVIHIVSVKTDTERGSWCPEPNLLGDAVYKALDIAVQRRCETVAFSALGTGSGRLSSQDSAHLMIEALRRWRQDHPDHEMQIELSLPSGEDYEAFAAQLHR